MRNAYRDSLILPHGHNSWIEPCGVPQMLSLLQGSACTHKKLKSIRGGVIDWKFWKQTDEAFKDLQQAVQYVQALELEFSATPDGEAALDLISLFGVEELESEIRECAGNLKNRRVEAFVTAARNLRRLDLRFSSFIPSKIRSFPADLSYVVGNHKWDFLADVTLSFFSSRAEDLIGFCDSHATTLQRLVISRIKLVEGSWLSTFQTMRRLLHLQQLSIHGRLEAVDECWDFITIDFPGGTTMGRVVQEYILQGGDGPLLDLEPYIKLNQFELEELKGWLQILHGLNGFKELSGVASSKLNGERYPHYKRRIWARSNLCLGRELHIVGKIGIDNPNYFTTNIFSPVDQFYNSHNSEKFTCLLICAHTLAKLCDHTSRLQDQMTTGLELLSCIPWLQFLILLAQHPATATDSTA
ncbi:hypothetical protein MMC22_000405 [Lobaria immixta]|nr:hypothetical protein [Lobaria immixta]